MSKKRTKANNVLTSYTPTDTEQKLLDVLLNPYHRMATVTRKCELVGISRTTYYEIMRKPDFSAYYNAAVQEAVKNKAGQLVNIAIREAQKGGSQGFGYWKELAKMADLLKDDKQLVQHTGEISVTFVAHDAPETDESED